MRETVVDVVALRRWIDTGSAAAERAAALLERIASPRPELAARPCIMGIVNVTPDSFSDGGTHLDPGAALAHCEALAAAGADILDIGGESTRPGAAPVPPEEEIARVLPVLEGLRARRARMAGVAVSIDTRHAAVMRAALAAGADIVNDVTALAGDRDSLAVAAAGKARVVLMHMQGTPETMNLAPAYEDIALDVFDFLEARIAACTAAGIARERLIVDPGLGFGKRGRQNREILRALPLFHGLGCPILLGASRKGFGSGQSALSPKGACRHRSAPPCTRSPPACRSCACTTSPRPGRLWTCGGRWPSLGSLVSVITSSGVGGPLFAAVIAGLDPAIQGPPLDAPQARQARA